METENQNQNEAETTPFEQRCPQHGARIRRYFGCPRCVIEEVRRHEKRIDVPLEFEEPIQPESVERLNELIAEIH